jgi:hypothetical protein
MKLTTFWELKGKIFNENTRLHQHHCAIFVSIIVQNCYSRKLTRVSILMHTLFNIAQISSIKPVGSRGNDLGWGWGGKALRSWRHFGNWISNYSMSCLKKKLAGGGAYSKTPCIRHHCLRPPSASPPAPFRKASITIWQCWLFEWLFASLSLPIHFSILSGP